MKLSSAKYLIGLSAGGLSLIGVEEHLPPFISKYFTPTIDRVGCTIFFVLLIVGLVLYLQIKSRHASRYILIWSKETTSAVVSKFKDGLSNKTHSVCFVAKRTDLSDIHKIGLEHFGSAVSGMNLMKEWIKKWEKTFHIIKTIEIDGKKRAETVRGYFCVLPLTKEASDELTAEKIRGNGIRKEHVTSIEEAESLYIGAIVAKGASARAIGIATLLKEFKECWFKRNDFPIYTRPLTNDGLRLTRKFGFKDKDGREPELNVLVKAEASDIRM